MKHHHPLFVHSSTNIPFVCVHAAAFLTQTVCLDDTTVKFEIWDTAGQERYHSLAPMYYRGAQAAIVVYDITNQVCLFVCAPSSVVRTRGSVGDNVKRLFNSIDTHSHFHRIPSVAPRHG